MSMSIQWSLVIFTLLTGAGGCLFAFIGLNEITRWSKKDTFAASIVALLLAIVGGLASVTHLSHPGRIMNALSHPASGIFIEAVLVGILCVLIIVYLVCIRRNASAAAKVLAIVGGVAGLALSFMAGHSYIMAAQTAWATMLLPLGYLLTALATGAGLWWALLAPDAENGAPQAVLAAVVCAVLAVLGVCAFAAAAGAFSVQAAVVWGAVVCEVLAVVLALASRAKPQPVLAWLFVAVTAVASLLFRVLMWTVGGGMYGFFS